MHSILDQLQELANADLYALCEAVDLELQRREEVIDEAPEIRRVNEPKDAGRGAIAAATEPRLRRSAIRALARRRPGDALPERVDEEYWQGVAPATRCLNV